MKSRREIKRIFLGIMLIGTMLLAGCATMTSSERLTWDYYFKQIEEAHQINTAFLLENPKYGR